MVECLTDQIANKKGDKKANILRTITPREMHALSARSFELRTHGHMHSHITAFTLWYIHFFMPLVYRQYKNDDKHCYLLPFEYHEATSLPLAFFIVLILTIGKSLLGARSVENEGYRSVDCRLWTGVK